MSKALDSGKSLAEAVLAKLPESLREQAKAALLAPEATDALTLLGDSALARSDYSRQMDEIRAKTDELKAQEDTLIADHRNLTEWYAEKKAVIDKYPSLSAVEQELAKARGGIVPPPAEVKPPASGLSKEDLERYLSERDQARDEGYANVLGLTTTLTARHLRDFNEVLDMNELIQHAKKHRVALFDPRADTDAYRTIHGEKIKTRQATEEAARVQKLVDEKLAEERKKYADQPFPLRNREASVLDVLQQPDRKASDYTLDAAVAEYERLQSSRT